MHPDIERMGTRRNTNEELVKSAALGAKDIIQTALIQPNLQGR